jgi:RimJ/RimL family protein N-acetyltransferase
LDKKLLQVPAFLETTRLILRPYQPADAPAYYRMSCRNKEHLSLFESGNAVMTINSEEAAAEVIQGFIRAWEERTAFFMGAFLKNSGIFAAQVYIGVVNWGLPEFEIGYFADADHEGEGYVTEAVKGALGFIFDSLGAHRIRLECDETNVRSLRVAECCGFIREGHIHETKRLPDGSFRGDLIYGLLRSEYKRGLLPR